jgi:immune inhibitor A
MKHPVRKLRPSRRGRFGLLLASVLLATTLTASAPAPAVESNAPIASGWTTFKFPQGQPACTGFGFGGAVYYDRLDCGFGYVGVTETRLTNPNRSVVKVSFIDSGGTTRATQTTTARTADNAWQFIIQPSASWAPGTVTIRVSEVDPDGVGPEPNQVGNFGETTFILNELGASLGVVPKPDGSQYVPGDAVSLSGNVYEIDQVPPLAAAQERGVAATFFLRAVTAAGDVRGPYGPFTAETDGTFTATLPGVATEGLTADASTGYEIGVSIEAVQASYTDALTGAWAAARAGAAPLVMAISPTELVLENSFLSAAGWVKPGDSYPFRVFVKNFTDTPATGAQVTIPAADGMVFTNATAIAGSGTVSFSPTSITWTVGSIAARGPAGPALKTLVVEARADTLGEDAQVVWKNLSTTATLTYDGGPTIDSESNGPKVIPPDASFDTAQYGDKPFPVVPVDYFDRKHEDLHTSDRLSKIINSQSVEGSTRNLFAEMSFGQLITKGGVPTAAIATKGWEYGPGFEFTSLAPQGSCGGTTFKDFRDSSIYPERVSDGWYQLPGTTGYYGSDRFGSAIPGAVVPGAGLLLDIDSGCGPTGKLVYDAAQIADPEIDYSDYDTDKDGVVDFFMAVFAGAGGNGVSQTSVPPYDNVWPHSSSLEFYYSDPATGLKGYISDDQLRDFQERPLYYTDASRSAMTPDETEFPVYVRVGPYNVNPESAIDHASVISHEYGHALGLPDFYSLGGRETYSDWTLLSQDKSQHLDVFGKQELGWIVPRVLDPGTTTTVDGWRDSKVNTHRIDWKDANGDPYTLEGPSVNNGEAYVAKLPGRQIIDPAEVPSGDHVWWSRSGNGFGCTPQGARNLDIALPELEGLAPGTPVTVTLKSKWNIEWDYDYGFVMYSTDGGETYTSLPSEGGYTTPQGQNPNANSCQAQYGNGLTGTSGSYAAGTQASDRLLGEYPDGGFLADEFDLTAAAGNSTVVRLSYSTDPGLARPGWFIDDLRIEAGGQVIYETDFEASGDENDPRVYNGGCKATTRVAAACTPGWQYVSASEGSPADHAYYMEMRDRSSFDFDSKGQNERDPLSFLPGMLLVYTDEAHGYGNVGVDDPPAQTPVDSQPQPGNATPNLDDAAWTAAAGDNAYSDFGVGHTDNYEDPASPDGLWHFQHECLSFEVTSMSGTDVAPAMNLQGDVQFTTGAGCAEYDYGYEGGNFNAPPIAVAQARPITVAVGEEVTFDGSMSTDDAPGLTYGWDFGDGNTGSGQVEHHAYSAPGTYTATLTVTDAGGLENTDSVVVTVLGKPNLRVTNIVASNNKARQGDKVTFTATIDNNGGSAAGASQTEFKLDDTTVVGVVATDPIAAGASRPVAVEIRTSSLQGQHTMRATADIGNAVDESSELDQSGVLTFEIQGNKVKNGSFAAASSGGSAPESWTGSSTPAGSASYSQSGGSEGSAAASMSGNGGNAAVHGSPTWTSDPIAVVVGETLDFRVLVSTFGASTAPTAGLVYLGPLGNVVNTVNLITAPLTTLGFATLEQAVTIPPGVADVRVVLRGFAPTDVSTAGTVTFDDVGLFEQ